MEKEQMIVKAWHNGSGVYGITIGVPNRNKYFNSTWTEVKVELNGILHTFALTPGFWNDCPEFRDKGKPHIKKWLQEHKTLDWPKNQKPEMELIQIEASRFRLVP